MSPASLEDCCAALNTHTYSKNARQIDLWPTWLRTVAFSSSVPTEDCQADVVASSVCPSAQRESTLRGAVKILSTHAHQTPEPSNKCPPKTSESASRLPLVGEDETFARHRAHQVVFSSLYSPHRHVLSSCGKERLEESCSAPKTRLFCDNFDLTPRK